MNKLLKRQHWIAFVELICAILAAGLWFFQDTILTYTDISMGAWPLLLLALLGILRWRRTGHLIQRSRFIPPLTLFMLTALLGLWTAYDPTIALRKFWMIVAALGLCWAMAGQPDLTSIYLSLALWGFFGVILTSYFLMTHDWMAYPIKVPILTDLGGWLSTQLPDIPLEHINPNIVGGILATILPFYAPLFTLARQSKRQLIRRWLPPLWIGAGVMNLMGVILAISRGAWIAIGITIVLWTVWRRREAIRQRLRQPKRRYAVIGALVIGTILILLATSMSPPVQFPGITSLQNRLTLWRNARQLARDYAFTGIGLGMFEMHYAVYALLIHVGFVNYAHNLFLDLLIELGILGLGAYLWLITTTLVGGVQHLRRTHTNTAWIIEAGLACQIIVVIHGLVDDVLFSSRALFLLLLPFGVLTAAFRLVEVQARSQPEKISSHKTWKVFAHKFIIALTCFAVVVWWFPLLSAWHANLGALAQARVELSHYDQKTFDVLSMDDIRQQVDLGQAIRSFQKALSLNPKNLTAHQRLASIALSRGDEEQALAHMQVAWEANHRDATTRLLMGDSLVANGDIDLAVEIVQGQKFAKERMAGQAWSRYWVHDQWEQAIFAWEAVRALTPDDPDPDYWIKQAQKRIQAESASK